MAPSPMVQVQWSFRVDGRVERRKTVFVGAPLGTSYSLVQTLMSLVL